MRYINNNFWSKKKVLITGHTGFKGSWLSIWLNNLNAKVIGISLRPATKPSLFYESRIANKIHSVIGNICDYDLVYSVIKNFKPEIIIHMAAQPFVRQSYDNPRETYTTNVIGTVNLLEAARKVNSAKVIVNVTSDKCYENYEKKSGYTEHDRLGGHDPYSSSKGCSEILTASYRRSYFNKGNIALSSVRAGNVIGGGDWNEGRLIPDILNALKSKKKIIIRKPNSIRPWQHVIEVLSGYMILCENMYYDKKKFSGAWNFGPKNINSKSVKWIVNKMIKLWGTKASWKLDAKKYNHETSILRLNIKKAQSSLDWSPIMDLEQSIKSVIKWHKDWISKKDPMQICLKQISNYNELKKSR